MYKALRLHKNLEYDFMKDRIKYILIGIIIGIAIGMIIFYLLMTFRIIIPFGFGSFREFAPNSNFTNFTRLPRGV